MTAQLQIYGARARAGITERFSFPVHASRFHALYVFLIYSFIDSFVSQAYCFPRTYPIAVTSFHDRFLFPFAHLVFFESIRDFLFVIGRLTR